ncbi:hypothetical protein GOODEAATRI_024456 [Goodea atripinnis]|uniref:Uncharacterized protein n=1 Tax=Goodea atripinnis TaxID=208336 RepID=A0ABV0N6C3_9TELE
MHSCFEFFFPGWSFPFNPQDSLFWRCLVIHINYVHAVPVINLTLERQLTAPCAAQGALFFHLSTCPPKCLCTPLTYCMYCTILNEVTETSTLDLCFLIHRMQSTE